MVYCFQPAEFGRRMEDDSVLQSLREAADSDLPPVDDSHKT